VPVIGHRLLAHLVGIGRSPNTVKTYARDLKDLWQFLGFQGLDWRESRLDDTTEFGSSCAFVYPLRASAAERGDSEGVRGCEQQGCCPKSARLPVGCRAAA